VALENEVEKEEEKNQSLHLELQRKEADFRTHVKEMERRVEKARSDMQGEREYFQGKSKQLNAMIYNLETQLNFKTMEVDRKQEGSNEAKITEMMKAKNAQIQELLGELERI
jgi:predicted RNase H-like nuclease (RuvC/YqgF family)